MSPKKNPSLLPIILLVLVLMSVISSNSSSVLAQDQNPPVNKDELKGDDPEIYTGERFVYAYSANQTEIGATGLFTVFDANTLRRREFRIGFSATRFHRDPSLRITQFPVSGTYAVRNWLEVFGSFNPYQRVGVNSPNQTSGALLNSALTINGGNSGNLLNNVNQNFFLLSGLSVSGALVGGVLPGLPVGTPRPVFDPILNRQKNAFTTPKYFNDLPFAGRSGSTTGDILVGAKFRTPFRLIAELGGKKVVLSQTSVLSYVKFSSQGAGNLLSNPNDALFRGSGSGTTDFSVALLHSFYLPNCLAKKLLSGKDTCALNPEEEILKTTNIHTNIGYIRNGDPKAGGIKLIDRKDAVIFGFGMDRVFGRYVQALAESKFTRYVGGGTPNLRNNSPVDITAGFRFFPLGLPKIGQLQQSRLFFSVGGGYRYSFNVSELGGLAKNNHGFVFQLNFGRSNKTSADDSETKKRKACQTALESFKKEPLAITSLTVDKESVQKGQDITLVGQVTNGEASFMKYEVKLPNGNVVDRFGGGDVADGRFDRTIKTDFEAGENYKFEVTAKYFKGEFVCTETEKESNPFRIITGGSSALVLDLLPQRVGPISANTPQNIPLTASIKTDDLSRTVLNWQTQPEISLSGTNKDLVREVNSTNLRPGGRYLITLTARNGEKSDEKQSEIIVNNPPTVSLQLSSKETSRGTSIKLLANGNDADGDKLTYSWNVLNRTGQVVKTWQSDEPDQTLDTNDLVEGESFTVQVTVSDKLDEATSNPEQFSIDLPGPQVFFEFDRDKINVRRKQRPIGEEPNQTKLKAVADRLKQQPDLTLFVRVEGNADQLGSIKYNECLGCRRACAVKRELMRLGVDEGQIRIIVSFGESKAEGKLSEFERRKRDRRVDLIFTREGETLNLSGIIECNCQRMPQGSKCPRQ